jgi:hypothetical protein
MRAAKEDALAHRSNIEGGLSSETKCNSPADLISAG